MSLIIMATCLPASPSRAAAAARGLRWAILYYLRTVRDAALVEAGLDLRVLSQVKVGQSQLAGHVQDHAVKGYLTWNF